MFSQHIYVSLLHACLVHRQNIAQNTLELELQLSMNPATIIGFSGKVNSALDY